MDDRNRSTVIIAGDGENIQTHRVSADENPDPVIRVTRQGEVLYANPAAAAFLHSLERERPGFVPSRWNDDLGEAIEKCEPVRRQMSTQDATYSLTFVNGSVPDTINIFGHNITPRVKVEQRLELLATAIEQADETILITDEKGLIRYVNPAFERITGYKCDEVLGKKPSMMSSGKHDDTFYARMWKTIRQGEVWRGAFTNRRKDGTLYEELATVSPVRNKNGEIVSFVAVKSDVTEQLRLKDQLLYAQRMEALGTLAGGIAHDFNNLLMAILGYAELARRDAEQNPRLGENLDHIVLASERAADLVKQILTFRRETRGSRRPMRIQPLLKEAAKLLQGSLPSGINLICSVDPACGYVMGNTTEMHQVIMNLCINAVNAINDGSGTVEVNLREERSRRTIKAAPHDIAPGDYVVLTVRDDGCGIPGDVMPRIFEPYFTTREAGRGTGLGLATVHGVIAASGGGIAVETEQEVGSCFSVYFPLCTTATPSLAPARPKPAEKKTRVLLVDDEELLARFLRSALESLGHEAVVHTDSREALKAFIRDPNDFDVVLTDQVMPGLSGLELAEAIQEKRPGMPILLTTGFSQSIAPETCSRVGILEILRKPIVLQDLSRAIKSATPRVEEGAALTG